MADEAAHPFDPPELAPPPTSNCWCVFCATEWFSRLSPVPQPIASQLTGSDRAADGAGDGRPAGPGRPGGHRGDAIKEQADHPVARNLQALAHQRQHPHGPGSTSKSRVCGSCPPLTSISLAGPPTTTQRRLDDAGCRTSLSPRSSSARARAGSWGLGSSNWIWNRVLTLPAGESASGLVGRDLPDDQQVPLAARRWTGARRSA